jgi:hypothetical protein
LISVRLSPTSYISRVHPSPTDARWRLSSEISRATHRRVGERPHSPLYGRFEIEGYALRELNGGLYDRQQIFRSMLRFTREQADLLLARFCSVMSE